MISRAERLQQFRLGVKLILGMDRAARQVSVFPDDIFLVSYPKSGNTWTRFLAGNLISPNDPITFANLEQRLGADSMRDRQLLKFPRPRLIKSHEPFDPRYRKVILIVRDPRDVAVSYYYYSLKIGQIEKGLPFEKYVPRFIANTKAVGALDPFGPWGENVGSWLGARRGSKGFLLLRYEDLLSDTPRELAKMATFLGLPPDAERINKAVELSAADRMRKLEQEQSSHLPKFVEGSLAKRTHAKPALKTQAFVRAAKSGGWREVLSPESVAQIEAAWPDVMRELGYLPATDKPLT